MKKRDCGQLPLDLGPPKQKWFTHPPLSYTSLPKEETEKVCNVVVLQDRRATKSEQEMMRIYSLIVARARHLFE